MFRKMTLMLALVVAIALPVAAQNSPGAGGNVTPVQGTTPFYAMTAISATAAINTQTTLTIPAPPGGMYNYVCSLSFAAVQDATATSIALAVTTSTNFNSFALKFSVADVDAANYQRDFYWGTPAGGCVKSAAPGTATTFVSPAGVANTTFTWYATYYQAP